MEDLEKLLPLPHFHHYGCKDVADIADSESFYEYHTHRLAMP